MSNILNTPPALDATGVALREAMTRRNALLSFIAEGKRDGVYADIDQIASIVRNGQGASVFPIGDQIVIPWKDMDDTNHNTDETAYQVPLDIVHHGLVELEDGEQVPGMFLQWHYCTPYGVQFSNFQAFYKAEAGLPAGDYSVTMGSKWGNYGVEAGSVWYFTLTQAVPAGGLLSGFETIADGATTRFRVKSWEAQDSVSPMETVEVSPEAPSDDVTSLGIMELTTRSTDGLNCMQRVGYGHNRYSVSAIRQFVNGIGLNWWTPQEEFDLRPDQYAKHGFLSGFNDDFLSAIKPVKVRTALNTVEGFTETEDVTYDRFFLPSLEQMFVDPQLPGVEGEYFEYWKRRIGRTSPAAQYSTYSQYKCYAINAKTSSQSVRVRSAYRGSAGNTWGVSSSGYICNRTAYYALRFAPVCVIC